MPDGTPAKVLYEDWLMFAVVVPGVPSSTLMLLKDIAPDAGNVISTSYGVPYAVMSARVIKLPDESNDATFVPL